MDNEYYGAASTPTEDFLAHYGVRGMKWGVRKAIQSGNSAKLSKQYAKAEKKLAKLEKRAANASKYGKRAAAMGAGAAVAGGLAAAGTGRVGSLVGKVGTAAGSAMTAVGNAARKSNIKVVRDVGRATASVGRKIKNAKTGAASVGNAISEWGGKTHDAGGAIQRGLKNLGMSDSHPLREAASKSGIGTVSNNTLARVGAAAVGAGLAAGAARNAYKAATAKKKAENFRNQMKTSFAGTQYANRIGSGSSSTKSKKRRRS